VITTINKGATDKTAPLLQLPGNENRMISPFPPHFTTYHN